MPPPQQINYLFSKKSAIAAIVASLFSLPVYALDIDVIDNEYLIHDGDGDGEGTHITTSKTVGEIFIVDFYPESGQDKHAIAVNAAYSESTPPPTLTVEGNTKFESFPQPSTSENKDGTYAISAGNLHGASGIVNLEGNVDIVIRDAEGTLSEYGANAIYSAGKNSSVTLGSSAENLTRIFVVADKSDAISAKDGGSVTFKSENNQIIGAIDFIYSPSLVGIQKLFESKVEGTFSGSNSFWFGDDNSFANADTFPEDLRPYFELVKDRLSKQLSLTFKNGAQWTYLGIQNEVVSDDGGTSVTFDTKRISNITLESGGIINLYDDNIKKFCQEQGISGLIDHVDHDYVRVGYLNGSGGIFRIDTNGEDKTQTDLIFVENSYNSGVHHVQVEGLSTLNSISDTNTLTFALVSKEAAEKGVAFNETENVEGDKLFNYELDIRPVIVEDAADLEALKNKAEFSGLENILEDYTEGSRYWEIYRVVKQNSSSTLGMIGSGYAGYDLAVDMDRYDRRIHETVGSDKNSGLWIRASHGKKGASGVYQNDIDTVTVGFENNISPSNRLGAWFSYTQGDVDYSSVDGTADLDRYELAIYDTILLDNQYIDFVGRIGRVSNEFSVTSASGAYKTSGDFDQDYASLSAEYGYTLKDKQTGVFIEPQLQVQATYLRDFDYSVERGMKAKADDETSFIGRVGMRFGQELRTASSSGEFYFRGDVYHQFTDGQSARLTAGSEYVDTVWGDKDTWATFGVGGYLNWKDNMSFQVDVERTAGGETTDTWLVSGRFNYLF
ncbi:autotransporter family protein [Parasutterella secunda]|uniref:autotransporter family protein n=1 Tax=Parasutterella secunda TaxID=626947 RepID=UPI0021AC8E11|nr:autotransporter outer membrane beta-barrel domain-containing protein [Parasutterella secunda]MCR8921035.1 autotransporter outer membrane beta-barrel domain-containing protein [Parasutterella secunda]